MECSSVGSLRSISGTCLRKNRFNSCFFSSFFFFFFAGERPFKCTQCDKAFNQKSALQVHMVKHTGKKPFKCEVCGIRFTQKSNMKHHMKRSHGHGEQLAPAQLSAPAPASAFARSSASVVIS